MKKEAPNTPFSTFYNIVPQSEISFTHSIANLG